MYTINISESPAEVQGSTAGRKAEGRFSLKGKRLEPQEIISKIGPRGGDEKPFLKEFARRFALRHKPAMVTNSKYHVSRVSDRIGGEVSRIGVWNE